MTNIPLFHLLSLWGLFLRELAVLRALNGRISCAMKKGVVFLADLYTTGPSFLFVMEEDTICMGSFKGGVPQKTRDLAQLAVPAPAGRVCLSSGTPVVGRVTRKGR
jgi:hypothetical protein